MKIGIDSYCYHRFFGEVYDYPKQSTPAKRMSLEDFLRRSKELGVDGVSIESCFIPRFDDSYLSEIKSMLDEFGLERVYAWGHPDGLEGGKNEKAFDDMVMSLSRAKKIGASVMRVVGSSNAHRLEDHEPQLETLSKMFGNAAKLARKANVRIADENHIDFNSDEMLQLVKNVNSPYFGINFDTGNFLRIRDDPIKGMQKLAPFVYATHVKDLKPWKEAPEVEWFFYSSTPVGDGVVDNLRLGQLLKEAGYKGFLAVEIDFLHPDYLEDEDLAVEKSIKELKRIGKLLN
jgi:sugar phosphate isomerase/epimerase